MARLRIHIYDDDEKNVKKWAKTLKSIPAIEEKFSVHGLSSDKFASALSELDNRRDRARKGISSDDGTTVDSFDKADILVLDYDLFTAKGHRDLTGEEVAYLARCYSRCGILIALNQGCSPESNPFYLDLRQHPDSRADINCSSTQLGNPGLWGPWETGLRPWYWPNLLRAVRNFERCVADLREEGSLDHPVLDYLGLDDEHIGTALTPPLLKSIVPQGCTPIDMTFRDIAKGHLRPKDSAGEWTEALPQIAVAAVRAWLEQIVLPPQNILVDAPHMVSRFPSLLKEDSPTGWDRTTELWRETNTEIGIDTHSIDTVGFEKTHWLSRPAWYWQRLNELDLPERKDPWSIPATERVFCEDVSRFLPEEAARKYYSGLSPDFLYRWVVDPETRGGTAALSGMKVSYEPAWLLMV